ncbi:cobalamin biosynthesis protein CobQ [Candidatus Tenderia electrophaga]|uniref:Cobalamin biosynthesis protein CobQ n=1 Tax=Candidatus Tenderia electrophaga TaxID=1748243 RepID=A0A0S2TC28_9GAMM|nr:cobalamin biosynthesis protein CobQ [Candidatus Tenderia electrophaga]
MRVWAVANQKGGVGKTTSAVSLAGLLTQRGRRVLLLDIDPHGSLTSYFRFNPDELESSIFTLFQDQVVNPISVIRPTRFENLHLLPATMALATLDRQLGARSGMGLVLSRALKTLAGRYDYALIDCPPMLGVLMVNAMAACDHLVIPVQTEFLALKGLERMLKTLSMITRSRSVRLPYTIVPTMFDRRTRASSDTLRLLRTRYSAELWNAVIPVDTQFREASRIGVPLPLLAPQARGVAAYTRLLDTLVSTHAGERQAAVI